MPICKIRRYHGYKIKLGLEITGRWYFDIYTPGGKFLAGSSLHYATADRALAVARYSIGAECDYLNRNLQQ